MRVRGKALSRDQAVPTPDGRRTARRSVEDRARRSVKLHYDPWINAYQVEIWETLEPPGPGRTHHFQVLDQMGPAGPDHQRPFKPILARHRRLNGVELAFRENDVDLPFGYPIARPRRRTTTTSATTRCRTPRTRATTHATR